MTARTNYREKGLEKIRQQFNESTPITLEELEKMVASRRERGVPETTIQAFTDSIVVGETRFVYFMLYDHDYPEAVGTTEKGPLRATVLKATAISVAEAVAKLDDAGKFIEQDDVTSLPRLHKWR